LNHASFSRLSAQTEASGRATGCFLRCRKDAFVEVAREPI
jgi:hypothetical protein